MFLLLYTIRHQTVSSYIQRGILLLFVIFVLLPSSMSTFGYYARMYQSENCIIMKYSLRLFHQIYCVSITFYLITFVLIKSFFCGLKIATMLFYSSQIEKNFEVISLAYFNKINSYLKDKETQFNILDSYPKRRQLFVEFNITSSPQHVKGYSHVRDKNKQTIRQSIEMLLLRMK